MSRTASSQVSRYDRVRTFRWSLAVTIVVGCAGSPIVKKPSLQPDQTLPQIHAIRNTAPITLLVAGDVKDVLAGRAPAGDLWFDAACMRIAFEAGVTDGMNGLGEMLVVDGVAYARTTDRNSAFYYQETHVPRFTSSCTAGIPAGALPTYRLDLRPGSSPLSLAELLTRIFERTGTPTCVLGAFRFTQYHSIAISRPPIAGEPILEHKARYYEQPPVSAEGVDTSAMGCVARMGSVSNSGLRAGKGRVLYDNPTDTAAAATWHTHALRLSRTVDNDKEVKPDLVLGVNHLLTVSQLGSGYLDIFTIGDTSQMPNQSVREVGQ